MESEHEGGAHDLRIVLVGVSGVGKSSIGNAILGREAFKESRTRESEIQRGRVEDRNISIIDTPGFFNTQLTDEEMKKQMMKSLDLSDPGPHVFLLVINLENFEEDKRNIVEQIQENFGAQVFKFTMVLFTGRENMSKRKWMLFILDTKCQELVSHCSNYHGINSKNEINQTHIIKLLEKIDEFIKQNNHQHYNSGIFSVSRTKSIRIWEKQEEKQTSKKKEQEIKQMQTKTAFETFTTHRVIEERIYAVIEQVKEITREKTLEEEEEKEERQERPKIKSETFEMESATEEKTTHTVTEELTDSFVSYLRQRMKTSYMYENLDNESLDRFDEFSNEKTRDKNVGKTPGNMWEMSHKKTYHIKSEDLRIVMVGKTGAGKSATGNTILGQKAFIEKNSSESVTKECQKLHRIMEGRNISVIDTPGLCDTSFSKEQLKEEIVKCVYMSAPGPHAFLLVIRLDMRFTDEEKNTVKWIQKNFGEVATHYTIILFTRGDELETSIEQFLTENKRLNELVRQCKGSFHVFNNTDEENQSQVTELLKKIDIIVKKNGGEHYTNEMYKEAQRKIMMKKAQDAALVGASVAGVGAAVAGGAVLVAATGGVALPVALIAGGAALTGGTGAAKAIANTFKHGKGKVKRGSSKWYDD